MESRKKIAIIGASYLQVPLITKAKDMGYETHVFAWECGDPGEEIADIFYPVSIVEKERILQICKNVKVDGICSIASDLAMLTVNYIATELKLTGNSMETTLRSTNKKSMREAFYAKHDPIPTFACYSDYSEIDLEHICFPIILKPSDRSGSRGITKINKLEELYAAFLYAKEESFEKKVLIEEFIEGDEYSVEYISYKGEHIYLATTKKITTGAPHFIEMGHREPSGLSENEILKIKKIINHALDTLGIENGASHSEIKITPEGKIYIIEIGARMGGDCIGSHLVYYSTGLDYVQMVIQIALNEKPHLQKVYDGFPVEVKYIFNQADYSNLLELMEKENDKLLYISNIDMSTSENITDSSNRLGCYIRKI